MMARRFQSSTARVGLAISNGTICVWMSAQRYATPECSLIDMSYASTPTNISLTDPPHVVKKVTELMDANGRFQGAPGYANPIMVPGDVLIAINGTYVRALPIGGVSPAPSPPPPPPRHSTIAAVESGGEQGQPCADIMS
jgi:hypothetical protein